MDEKVDKIFQELEIEDEETKTLLKDLFFEQDKDENYLNELFGGIGVSSAKDKKIVDDIVLQTERRISNLIKTSVLLSFLEIRRQIKAIQRELAEMKKKDDSYRKSEENKAKVFKEQMKSLSEQIKEIKYILRPDLNKNPFRHNP